MLTAQNVSVSLARKPVLSKVDFTALPGEVTSIIGPSGAGKSTFLKALTGDLPFEGEIRLNDLSVRSALPAKLARMRAVLPQASPMAFPFTVLEVVRLGCPTPDRDRIAREAMAHVGLAGFAARPYQLLSGGEQQRVQLARVLAQVWEPVVEGMPRWLFLDEPVSSLDIGHQQQIMEIARTFAQRGGGVVMVMHDLNLTAMASDSIALLCRGELMIQGSPQTVLSENRLRQAFDCHLTVNKPPEAGVFVLPCLAS